MFSSLKRKEWVLRFPFCSRGRNVEKQYPPKLLLWFKLSTCIFHSYLNVEIRWLQLALTFRVISLSSHFVGLSKAGAAVTLLSFATSAWKWEMAPCLLLLLMLSVPVDFPPLGLHSEVLWDTGVFHETCLFLCSFHQETSCICCLEPSLHFCCCFLFFFACVTGGISWSPTVQIMPCRFWFCGDAALKHK